MTTGLLLWILIMALAAAFLLGNLVTAYKRQGGAIGQVPVMMFPAFIPLFAVLGLALVDRETGWPDWPLWAYGVLWLTTTLAAWWATILAGNLGERKAAAASGPRAVTHAAPMRFRELLDREILDSLRGVLGRRLTAAYYGVLAGDLPAFDPWSPNETGGCQSVALEFEGQAFELTWNENVGWQSLFRDFESHFSLTALLRGRGRGALSVGHVPPWSACIGQALQGFELLAPTNEPQAIRLFFPAQTVIVATGYGGAEALHLGDGDELLVFIGDRWPKPDWGVLYTSKEEA